MHVSVRPDICYKFENCVENGKNTDGKAILRPILVKFLGPTL